MHSGTLASEPLPMWDNVNQDRTYQEFAWNILAQSKGINILFYHATEDTPN